MLLLALGLLRPRNLTDEGACWSRASSLHSLPALPRRGLGGGREPVHRGKESSFRKKGSPLENGALKKGGRKRPVPLLSLASPMSPASV